MTRPANIVLVGSMGSGKSHVGRLLAARLNWRLLDTDDLVEEHAGRTITQIFAAQGEVGFRRLETRVLRGLHGIAAAVIATGGGIVLREENWPLLRELGPVVYLSARPETLWARLAAERAHRPLLATSTDPEATLRELLARRASAYAQADLEIATDDLAPEAVVTCLLERTGLRAADDPGGGA